VNACAFPDALDGEAAKSRFLREKDRSKCTMRKSVVLVIAVLTLATVVPAFADLQNVIVGGSVRIRGNYWTGPGNGDSATLRNQLFEPLFPWSINNYNSIRSGRVVALPGLRWRAVPGRALVLSPVSFSRDSSQGLKFVEQRTKINVKADFTDQVAASSNSTAMVYGAITSAPITSRAQTSA